MTRNLQKCKKLRWVSKIGIFGGSYSLFPRFDGSITMNIWKMPTKITLNPISDKNNYLEKRMAKFKMAEIRSFYPIFAQIKRTRDPNITKLTPIQWYNSFSNSNTLKNRVCKAPPFESPPFYILSQFDLFHSFIWIDFF